MGDDYDILCIDMLEELLELCTVERKPAKTVKKLTKFVTDWQRRRKNFEQYRKVSTHKANA